MFEKRSIKVIHQVPRPLRESALELYVDTFKSSLPTLALSDTCYRKLLDAVLDWRFVWAAIDDNRVVGLAGYQCPQGSFTGAANPIKLVRTLGLKTFLQLLHSPASHHRAPKQAELLHDGLVVASSHRRLGIATQLLEALAAYARHQQFQQMRLDVAPDNHQAMSLYQQMGYIQTSLPPDGRYMTFRRELGRGGVRSDNPSHR